MKNIKLTFAPGAFDNFEGTQEELDELIATLQQMAESGELIEQFTTIGAELDDLDLITQFSNDQGNRTLQ